MEENKHTPGPWIINEATGLLFNERLDSSNGTLLFFCVNIKPEDKYLIARAPEMAADIQSLQQQNAQQAARIEALDKATANQLNTIESLRVSSDGWNGIVKQQAKTIQRQSDRIAELEKQLKEAQEQAADKAAIELYACGYLRFGVSTVAVKKIILNHLNP